MGFEAEIEIETSETETGSGVRTEIRSFVLEFGIAGKHSAFRSI
jgi:hypothetical protein